MSKSPGVVIVQHRGFLLIYIMIVAFVCEKN